VLAPWLEADLVRVRVGIRVRGRVRVRVRLRLRVRVSREADLRHLVRVHLPPAEGLAGAARVPDEHGALRAGGEQMARARAQAEDLLAAIVQRRHRAGRTG